MASQRNIVCAGDAIGEGDCSLVQDFLPPELAEHAFEHVRDEVEWHRMVHRGTWLKDTMTAFVDTCTPQAAKYPDSSQSKG